MYDAIIVGARCGGAPTAMLLARKGYRVLLLDRDVFPSDVVNGYQIHAPGLACLRRWGLLDRLAATGCPPITRWSLDLGPITLTGTPPPFDGIGYEYNPRRFLLDALLVDAAVEAGVELRQGTAVHELVWDDDRVTGVRLRASGGGTPEEHGRIVVGADGQRSWFARAVQAPAYDERPGRMLIYYTHWGGLDATADELYLRERRILGVFPTNGGRVAVAVGAPIEEFERFRADIEGKYWATVALAPSLAARLRDARREERFIGMADPPACFRRPYGPGWALVGDAGYHKSPITAQGITDAFRDAELLSDAIDAGFSGRTPLPSAGAEGGSARTLDEALAGYERRRNEAVRPMYEYTDQLSALQPPPEMQALLAALPGNQEQIDRFLGTMAGTVPIPEFFLPENVARITGAAAA